MVIEVAFAGSLIGLGGVGGPVGLTAGLIGVRTAGQAPNSLAATTLVTRTITHRRSLALGLGSSHGRIVEDQDQQGTTASAAAAGSNRRRASPA